MASHQAQSWKLAVAGGDPIWLERICCGKVMHRDFVSGFMMVLMVYGCLWMFMVDSRYLSIYLSTVLSYPILSYPILSI